LFYANDKNFSGLILDSFDYTENFEEEKNTDEMKPPLLYVRPDLDEVKEMVRNYLEIKKML
jgi:hypothetical protein